MLVVAALASTITASAQTPAPKPGQGKGPPPQAGPPPPPTPFNQAVLSMQKPGSTYVLGPGTYGPMDLRGLPKGLTIDMSQARIRGLRFYNANGLTLQGGRLEGSPGRRGVEIYDSQDVKVQNLKGTWAGLYIYRSKKVRASGLEIHSARGFFAEESEDVVLRASKFMASPADSVNFNGVKGLLIEDVAVIASGYDPKDPLSTVNQHPDAIQGWGNNDGVTIRRVAIACRCQGIFIKDGEANNVVVEDVVAILDDYKWVVAVQNARQPPRLKNVKAWGMPGGPRPGLDFRRAQTATPWIDDGGNEVEGVSFKGGDIMLSRPGT